MVQGISTPGSSGWKLIGGHNKLEEVRLGQEVVNLLRSLTVPSPGCADFSGGVVIRSTRAFRRRVGGMRLLREAVSVPGSLTIPETVVPSVSFRRPKAGSLTSPKVLHQSVGVS